MLLDDDDDDDDDDVVGPPPPPYTKGNSRKLVRWDSSSPFFGQSLVLLTAQHRFMTRYPTIGVCILRLKKVKKCRNSVAVTVLENTNKADVKIQVLWDVSVCVE
jgi:hypothetical protein